MSERLDIGKARAHDVSVLCHAANLSILFSNCSGGESSMSSGGASLICCDLKSSECADIFRLRSSRELQ
jgi:hypothetical protein